MSISKRDLLTADRSHVVAALSQFSGKRSSDWLPLKHPAKNGTLPRTWPSVNKLDNQVLIDAVAASAPNHCIDGWSYVSRALSALLAGDQHAARHLAYYAQLRAGLSMLGHLGIGIFNGINFAIDELGGIVPLDDEVKLLGTHAAVWQSLQAWVSEPSAARAFLDMVRIGNSTLATCLEAIWPGATATAAGVLVSAWGIDLQRGETEHKSRNMSSYNAQAFEPIPNNPSESLNFVEHVWDLFEPTASGRFDRLDRSLLRALLWEQHKIVEGNEPREKGPIFRRYEQLPENIQAIASKDFLLGVAELKEPRLLRQARMGTFPATATQMVARALLLLRAATAFTISNFNEAGVRSEDGSLRQWIDPIALARGFWGIAEPLEDPSDLWEDVRLALTDLSKSKVPPPTCLNDWMRKFPGGLPIISEAERIGVWSFGS